MEPTDEKILLVGAGPMAVAYAQVMAALQVPFIVVGRGQPAAQRFEQETGVPVATGGVEQWLQTASRVPQRAIVAVNPRELGTVATMLLNRGVPALLVEKPAGFDYDDIQSVADCAKRQHAQVYVGYNRRCYASTIKARELIAADGGALSFYFEFTELLDRIPDAMKRSGEATQWFLANSTHVIDLAFYLGGKPETMHCSIAGSFDWHPQAAIYAGSGRSQTGALFTYQANWQSAGRWGVEVMTKRQRLILRPLETLSRQAIGSFSLEPVALADELDQKFKPGLYRQVEAFIRHPEPLLTIEAHAAMLGHYRLIDGGGTL